MKNKQIVANILGGLVVFGLIVVVLSKLDAITAMLLNIVVNGLGIGYVCLLLLGNCKGHLGMYEHSQERTHINLQHLVNMIDPGKLIFTAICFAGFTKLSLTFNVFLWGVRNIIAITVVYVLIMKLLERFTYYKLLPVQDALVSSFENIIKK